jgi:hypothetical protein
MNNSCFDRLSMSEVVINNMYINIFIKKIHNLKTWFLSQGKEKQLVLFFAVATVLMVFAVPLETFRSYQRVFERESLGRAKQIVSRLAVDRVNLEKFLMEDGVRRVFVTDQSGLIIYPKSEFHQDGRKYQSVRDAINNGLSVVKRNGRVFELVEPFFEGTMVNGAAYLEFSTAYSSIWRPFLLLVKSAFLISVLMAVLFCGVMVIFKKSLSAPADDLVVKEKEIIHTPPVFENVNTPVVLFDAKFRITFANETALKIDQSFVGKHILDLDKKYIDMAEELEMHQLVNIRRDGATLWRITEGGEAAGYGLSF